MKVTSSSIFKNNQKFVLATQDSSSWILPELDGRNLINLPVSEQVFIYENAEERQNNPPSTSNVLGLQKSTNTLYLYTSSGWESFNKYTTSNTSSVQLNIDSSNNITANVIVASDINNGLVSTSSGLMVNVSNYVTSENAMLHEHDNKSVLDKINVVSSSLAYDGTPLNAINVYRNELNLSSMINNIVNINHNLDTTNIIKVALYYNDNVSSNGSGIKTYQCLGKYIVDNNNLQIAIPSSLDVISGTWQALVIAAK